MERPDVDFFISSTDLCMNLLARYFSQKSLPEEDYKEEARSHSPLIT
jgi:hypothetical protein